eukprot:267018-Prymnesium_polylepis.1
MQIGRGDAEARSPHRASARCGHAGREYKVKGQPNHPPPSPHGGTGKANARAQSPDPKRCSVK